MRIGIDIGGTKIEAIAIEGSHEVLRRRIASPRGDYDATIRAVSDLVAAIESERGHSGTVGVGIPGAISAATGLVKNANSTWLIGHPLDRDLEHALRRPVLLSNDANCFALSEAIDGAGRGARVVFGAILGTGVGGGIVVDGQVLDGPNAIAGEWGHNPLPWPRDDERPGPSCFCGHAGCIETWLAGPWVERHHASATTERISMQEIVERAGRGEASSNATLERYEERLARALAHVINLLDPDTIVLGGGLSNIERLYTNVPPRWNEWVFSDRVDTRLLRNVHGDSSGVRGAAWLWGRE